MSIANLISLEGQAWARTSDGQLRELRSGDALQPGEFLVTGSGSRGVLDLIDAPDTMVVGAGRVVELDALVLASMAGAETDSSRDDEEFEALLAALEDPEIDLLTVLDPAAAGAGAGSEDGGHDFVRLPRIVENVEPLGYEFDQAGLAELPGERDDAPAVTAAVPAETAPGIPLDAPTAPGDPVDPDPEDSIDPVDPDPEDSIDPEEPDPEDPIDPEEPEPEDPVPVTYVTHAHTVGASNAGTMANANGLKGTGHQSADVSRSGAGFYAVDHAAASDDPSAIESGEAILFELSEPVDSVSFEVIGLIHGATYHLYDADGVRFFEGSLEELESDEGLIVIEHDSDFSDIAFLGGSTGSGQSGEGSAFALRPVSMESGIDLISDDGEPDIESAYIDGDLLAEETAPGTEDEPLTTYRLGKDGALDLSDLLSEWEGDTDSLGDYLQASSTENGDTLLHISSEGGFGDGGLELADQTFLLAGIGYHDNILQELLDDEFLAIE
ncbi:MAG: retention module-containing protein [Halomonas sp.]|uniref:retention module-containing protein n=1 Tax=Halomonas sp. TaxID=1486246 RepID=UPI0039708B69